jgi:uncharacterized protein (DUF2267 family)
VQYDEFLGQVQQRARLGSRAAAAVAVRSTLSCLAERLAGGAAENLAAQLPAEIGNHLRGAGGDPRAMSPDAFIQRVAEREGVEPSDAALHIRAVLDVLEDATAGTLAKIRAQIPDVFDPLFDAGSTGEMRLEQ